VQYDYFDLIFQKKVALSEKTFMNMKAFNNLLNLHTGNDSFCFALFCSLCNGIVRSLTAWILILLSAVRVSKTEVLKNKIALLEKMLFFSKILTKSVWW